MLDFIVVILAIICQLTCVYFVLNGFLLIGFGFLGLGALGFFAVFEEELFR